MPANLKNAFTEENPDLHRQLGCMSGIFQMFDRRQRHLLTGTQHLVDRKRIHSGNMEAHSLALPPTPIIAEKNISRSMNHNQRKSTESSMPSLSTSSESSSFSSLECNKSTQPKNLPLQRNYLQQRSIDSIHDNSLNISHTSAQSRHHSLDFQDVVKEPIYRDTPNILANVKTSVDVPKKKNAPKHGNSPRPAQVPRMSNESRRSYKIKDDEVFSVSWESKRYSCDSYVKSASKAMKEQPRLSLDSKSSTENHNSNVVAKLMGLEGLPSLSIVAPSLQGDFRKSTSCKDGFGDKKNIAHLSNSPKIIHKRMQDWSPLLKRSNKDATYFETDPWRHEKYHGSQVRGLRSAEILGRQQRESIHHEINKKLEELEFLQSNKDFRALKQILNAIDKKKRSETRQLKEQQKLVAKLQNARTDESPPIVIIKPTNLIRKCSSPPTAIIPIEGVAGLRKLRSSKIKDNQPVFHSQCQAAINERTPKGSPKSNASPNHLQTSRNNKSNITNESSPHGPWVRKLQGSSSPRPPPSSMTNVSSTLRTSSSSSPRLHQRKHELKMKSHAISPSDAIKHQKQARQHTKFLSPRGNLRIKPKLPQCDEDQISRSTNTSTTPRLDVEVSNNSDKLTKQKLSSSGRRSFDGMASIIESKKSSVNLRGSSSAKFEATSGSEQPSPISVLDASVYKDDSPADEILCSFKDTETMPEDRNQTFLDIQLINPEMARNHAVFENKIVPVHEPHCISLTEKDSAITSHFNKLCASHDPNYPYISEILHATDFHSEDLRLGADHAINPNLFLVLEKKRAKFANTKFESNYENVPTTKTDQEKLQRKLMFDTVDELLVRKLGFGKSSYPHTRFQIPSNRELLQYLCLEINQLDTVLTSSSNDDDDNGLKLVLDRDVIHQSQEWSVLGSEVSRLVLNIERSIFKDLIEEVIGNVSAVCVQAKLNHCRRQLFAK